MNGYGAGDEQEPVIDGEELCVVADGLAVEGIGPEDRARVKVLGDLSSGRRPWLRVDVGGLGVDVDPEFDLWPRGGAL